MAPMQRRNLLRALIEKVVVNEWPSDLSPATLKRKNEIEDEYRQRADDLKTEGMRRRVEIVWR